MKASTRMDPNLEETRQWRRKAVEQPGGKVGRLCKMIRQSEASHQELMAKTKVGRAKHQRQGIEKWA